MNDSTSSSDSQEEYSIVLKQSVVEWNPETKEIDESKPNIIFFPVNSRRSFTLVLSGDRFLQLVSKSKYFNYEYQNVYCAKPGEKKTPGILSLF